jgi:hypothetical protein
VSFRAQVLGGQGVLARYGSSVLLLPAGAPLASQALDLLRQVHAEHPDAPGRVLPRKLAGLVAQSDDVPTLAVVSGTEDGLAVLLVGDVRMVLTTDTGTSAQSGRDASTWVDRMVRGPWSSLLLSLDGASPVDPLSDLGEGVVSAAGVDLSPTGAPAPPPAAAPAAPPVEAAPAAVPLEPPPTAAVPVADFETFSLAAPSEEASVPEQQAGQPDVPVVVRGITCARGHFNDPTSIYCAICGISMVQQTHNLVDGPRPPLGVLVLDDGSVYGLSQPYVLGREPEQAPEVQAGEARPLALEDPAVTMSRVHAKVQLVDWSVVLVDAGSANGTFVAAPGETEWTRLPSGGQAVLLPGTKVALGGRTLVFDSHHKL